MDLNFASVGLLGFSLPTWELVGIWNLLSTHSLRGNWWEFGNLLSTHSFEFCVCGD